MVLLLFLRVAAQLPRRAAAASSYHTLPRCCCPPASPSLVWPPLLPATVAVSSSYFCFSTAAAASASGSSSAAPAAAFVCASPAAAGGSLSLAAAAASSAAAPASPTAAAAPPPLSCTYLLRCLYADIVLLHAPRSVAAAESAAVGVSSAFAAVRGSLLLPSFCVRLSRGVAAASAAASASAAAAPPPSPASYLLPCCCFSSLVAAPSRGGAPSRSSAALRLLLLQRPHAEGGRCCVGGAAAAGVAAITSLHHPARASAAAAAAPFAAAAGGPLHARALLWRANPSFLPLKNPSSSSYPTNSSCRRSSIISRSCCYTATAKISSSSTCSSRSSNSKATSSSNSSVRGFSTASTFYKDFLLNHIPLTAAASVQDDAEAVAAAAALSSGERAAAAGAAAAAAQAPPWTAAAAGRRGDDIRWKNEEAAIPLKSSKRVTRQHALLFEEDSRRGGDAGTSVITEVRAPAEPAASAAAEGAAAAGDPAAAAANPAAAGAAVTAKQVEQQHAETEIFCWHAGHPAARLFASPAERETIPADLSSSSSSNQSSSRYSQSSSSRASDSPVRNSDSSSRSSSQSSSSRRKTWVGDLLTHFSSAREAALQQGMRLLRRSELAMHASINAVTRPTEDIHFALLAEVTSDTALKKMQQQMLDHPDGRRVLREKPLLDARSLDVTALRSLPSDTLGGAYIRFMDANALHAGVRPPVRLVESPELAYVLTRYRQLHDFLHVAYGVGISVEAEVALKLIEFLQTGLPATLLAAVFGPLAAPVIRARLPAANPPYKCGHAAVLQIDTYPISSSLSESFSSAPPSPAASPFSSSSSSRVSSCSPSAAADFCGAAACTPSPLLQQQLLQQRLQEEEKRGSQREQDAVAEEAMLGNPAYSTCLPAAAAVGAPATAVEAGAATAAEADAGPAATAEADATAAGETTEKDRAAERRGDSVSWSRMQGTHADEAAHAGREAEVVKRMKEEKEEFEASQRGEISRKSSSKWVSSSDIEHLKDRRKYLSDDTDQTFLGEFNKKEVLYPRHILITELLPWAYRAGRQVRVPLHCLYVEDWLHASLDVFREHCGVLLPPAHLEPYCR